MATRRNLATSTTLTTDLGGTVSAGDTVLMEQGALKYTASDLSASDLANFTLTEGFRGTFRDAGELKIVANRSGTGVFENRSNAQRIELRSTGPTFKVATIIQDGTGELALRELLCDLLVCVRGTTYINANVDVDSIVVARGATLIIADDATYPLLDMQCNGGRTILRRKWTGTIAVRGSAVLELASSTIASAGTLTQHAGAVKIINAASVSAFNGFAGSIDVTQAERLPAITSSVHYPDLLIRKRLRQSEPDWGSLTAPAGAAERDTI